MVSISNIIRITSCSFVLSLGLSYAAQADTASPVPENMTADQTDRRQGGQVPGEQQDTDKVETDHSQSGKTITGEVLRVEGDSWFVKEENGKEVRLHIDQTTQRYSKTGEDENMQGAHIEALVNDQNHALSIRSPDRRDDRHDHPSKADAGESAR